jgi:hypothetical protein
MDIFKVNAQYITHKGQYAKITENMRNKVPKKGDKHHLRAISSALNGISSRRRGVVVPLTLLALSASVLTAGAQELLFVDVTSDRLPAVAGRCMDAAAADADGDGDIDIALAMEFEPNILLINDGGGRFADASDRLPRDVHDSEDIAFADFDADGDFDLILVSEDDRTDEFYLNDGQGRFVDASTRLPTDDVSNALAVIDLDRDGAADILTGNIGTDRVLLNDGAANFADATRDLWPQSGSSRTQDIELADIDRDGDLDVIVAKEGQNELFVNDAGRLVDETAARLPRREDETREIRAADVDADGDLDLVVANVSFLMDASPQDYLLLNDGSGVFTTADVERFPEDARSNFTVQLVDLDADGDPDVVAPATDFAATGAGDYLVLSNDGRGRFTAAAGNTVLPASATGNGFDIEVADFDADGRNELLLCSRASGQNPTRSGGVLRLLTANQSSESSVSEP